MIAIEKITDLEVCEAYRDTHTDSATGARRWPQDLLQERTGQPFNVCLGAMQRALRRDLIDYGIHLRSGWLTERGQKLLACNRGATSSESGPLEDCHGVVAGVAGGSDHG